MLGRFWNRAYSGTDVDWEPAPGVAPGTWLSGPQKWVLAGRYVATHQMVGPWHRRTCAVCGTRTCPYRRWADSVMVEKTRRDWRGQ